MPLFFGSLRGLSLDTLKVGAWVRVGGFPSTRVEHELHAERITVVGKIFDLR
ncbi:hypothetical protein [Microvirga sp. 2TAF3]|uniref:hypothetical protein n=1 Tax=Microvirga sp. 2TAF3 TaxID=3233014 RepID=UPI003F98CA22